MLLPLALVAAAAYALAAWLTWRNRPGLSAVALVAVLSHGIALGMQIVHADTLRIGTNEAVSLFTWQSAALLWVLCWREPLRALGIVIYPTAALFAIWAAAAPSPLSNVQLNDWKTSLHVLISVLSAGLLTLAAAQTLVLAAQERLLHRQEFGGLVSRLPPLQTMERLLFQLVGIGFVMLSVTLLTGLWFIHDWISQHLAHKTVLSFTAWLIFGVLLWGRWRHGWRGRTAIRWALSGYATLILAYFGSKFILEQILFEHWAT